MIRKPKYILISLLVVVLIAASFFTTSCEVMELVIEAVGIGGAKTIEEANNLVVYLIREEEDEEEECEEVNRQAELGKAWEKEKKEKEQAAEEAALAVEEAELLEGFEEEEELIPDEPITYSGDALGLDVVLIVDFKTTTVTGLINLSGDVYVDATITDGEIDIDTFEIIANFSGIIGMKEYGEEEGFFGIITGIISEDYSTFNGVILDDEGWGGKFTASR